MCLNWALYLIKFVTRGSGAHLESGASSHNTGNSDQYFPRAQSLYLGHNHCGGLTLLASNLGFFPCQIDSFFIVPVLVLLAVFPAVAVEFL